MVVTDDGIKRSNCMKVVFNGAIFATGKKDGIPRYTLEILKALDEIVDPGKVELLVPSDVDFKFNNIKIVRYCNNVYRFGKFGGELWRQFCVLWYAKNNCIIVDLGMMLPFLRNDICAIYDCQPEKYPNNYDRGLFSKIGKKIRMAQRKNAINKSNLIISDSNDAADDIVKYYGVSRDKIKVIYCGWQHFSNVELNDEIFEKYDFLKKNNYYFSLGSRFKHKNIEWVLEAAKQNPNYYFVITGYNNVASYSSDIIKEPPKNVIFTGFLDDSEIKSLMTYCKAFIHPSFNEGFGMPPLEALSTGAEVIVSNVSCLPEVYEGCAHYINPYDYDNIDLEQILSGNVDEPDELLKKYSWKKSALQMLEILNNYIVL